MCIRDSPYSEQISQTQEIRITDASGKKTLETLRSKEQIENFINHLEITSWKMEAVPENAEKSGIFTLSQEMTRKSEQGEESLPLSDICNIYSYRNVPYVSFQVLGVTMEFHVSEKTQEYLNSYFP